MPPVVSSDQRFFSLRGFCQLLNIGLATGSRLVMEGLPTMQPAGPGGRHIIDVEEALLWLKEQDRKKRAGPPRPPAAAKKAVTSRTKISRPGARTSRGPTEEGGAS